MLRGTSKNKFKSIYNNKSWEEALLDSSKKIKSLAFVLTKDKYIAEDLLQDTIVRAISKKDMFSGSYASLSGWMIRIMKNIYFDQIRKLKSFSPVYIQDQEHMDFFSKKSENYGESNLHYNDILEIIDKCLVPRSKKIFFMQVDGYKTKEIASKLNVSSEVVRYVLHTSKNKLRKEIEKYEEKKDKETAL